VVARVARVARVTAHPPTSSTPEPGHAHGRTGRSGRTDVAYRFRTTIDIRFRDIDALGHVNNAVYLTYFEMARIAYLSAVYGRPLSSLDLSLVVAEAHCRYRSPAVFGERLVVEVAMVGLRSRAFELSYRVSVEGDGRLVAEGDTMQVSFNSGTKRVALLDPTLAAALGRFERGAVKPSGPS